MSDVVRAVAMFVGSLLVQRGWMSESLLQGFVGLAVAVGALVWAALDAKMQARVREGVRRIQAIYNDAVIPEERIKEDGNPGPVTVSAFEERLK